MEALERLGFTGFVSNKSFLPFVVAQTGDYQLDASGLLQSGLMVRHLILPECVDNTLDVIDWFAAHFPDRRALFSLMAQYTPMPDMPFPELRRTVSDAEYAQVMRYLSLSGIENGYVQELGAASETYIPKFNT